jgi:hypothetical protein
MNKKSSGIAASSTSGPKAAPKTTPPKTTAAPPPPEPETAVAPIETAQESGVVPLSELLNCSDLSTEASTEYMKQWCDEQGSGLENMDPRDVIVVPQLLLNQGGSEPVKAGLARAGSFWDTAANKEVPAPIMVVPLLTLMTRVRWAPIDANVPFPLCSSTDGKTGNGDPGGECARCPKRKLWDNAAKKMIGECDSSYSFIFYVFNHPTPVLMSFNRTKVRVARQIIKLLAAPPRLSIFCYAFMLSTKLEERPGVPSFQSIELGKFKQTNDVRLVLSDARFAPYLVEFKKLHEHYAQLHRDGKLLPKYETAGSTTQRDDDYSALPSDIGGEPPQDIAAQSGVGGGEGGASDIPF